MPEEMVVSSSGLACSECCQQPVKKQSRKLGSEKLVLSEDKTSCQDASGDYAYLLLLTPEQ